MIILTIILYIILISLILIIYKKNIFLNNFIKQNNKEHKILEKNQLTILKFIDKLEKAISAQDKTLISINTLTQKINNQLVKDLNIKKLSLQITDLRNQLKTEKTIHKTLLETIHKLQSKRTIKY
jgi:hypothetical protein